MDLLPGALSAAWGGTPPKTTVEKLYTELRNQKGRPWPARQFIEVLNEAVHQGILVRGSGGTDFSSVSVDGTRELLVPKEAAPPRTPKTTPGSPMESSEATMDLSKLQDFVDERAPALAKLLAGASPEFLVRIRLKGKMPANMAVANELLKSIHPGWEFGGR